MFDRGELMGDQLDQTDVQDIRIVVRHEDSLPGPCYGPSGCVYGFSMNWVPTVGLWRPAATHIL